MMYYQKQSPMGQLIPRLTKPCRGKHASPLCQALVLPVLTGRGSALFLPIRYASCSTMSDDKVLQQYFQFHETWACYLLMSLADHTLLPRLTVWTKYEPNTILMTGQW